MVAAIIVVVIVVFLIVPLPHIAQRRPTTSGWFLLTLNKDHVHVIVVFVVVLIIFIIITTNLVDKNLLPAPSSSH